MIRGQSRFHLGFARLFFDNLLRVFIFPQSSKSCVPEPISLRFILHLFSNLGREIQPKPF